MGHFAGTDRLEEAGGGLAWLQRREAVPSDGGF